MNNLDIIIVVFLIIASFKGYSNGFIKELAYLVAILVGAYGAYCFSHYAQKLLLYFVTLSEDYLVVLSFALTFIVLVIIIRLLAGLVTQAAEWVMIGLLNKILGAIFGIIKRALVIGVALTLLQVYSHRIPLINETSQQESVLYQPIIGFSNFLLPQILREIDKNIDFFQEQEHESLIKEDLDPEEEEV